MGAYEIQQGISLIPPLQSGSGAPGAYIDYSIQLSNWTLLTDTYSLALGLHTWETTLNTDTLGPLTPGSSQAFTVTVDIPAEAAWYQTDAVVITATSNISPTVYIATAHVATHVPAPYYLPVILK
jgi:hypothetical protein